MNKTNNIQVSHWYLILKERHNLSQIYNRQKNAESIISN